MVVQNTGRALKTIKVRHLTVGLNTFNDPVVSSNYSLALAQNARGRNYLLSCRYGTQEKCPSLGERAKNIWNAYPRTLTAEGRLYAAVDDKVWQLDTTTSPFTPSEVTLSSGVWTEGDYVSFADFGNLTFAFNGVDTGIELRSDDPDAAYPFAFEKPGTPGSIFIAGSLDGTYDYAIRWVRESSPGERLAWGPLSDPLTVAPSSQGVRLAFNVTPPPTADAAYLYRTLAGGGTFYYRDRIAVADIANTYDDTMSDNDLDTTRDDEDVLAGSALGGAQFACVDNRVMVLGRFPNDPTMFRWSQHGYGMEFPDLNYEILEQGRGPITGIAAMHGKLLVFRQQGFAVYVMDNYNKYRLVEFYPGFGNTSYHAVKHIIDDDVSVVTFWDENVGPCYYDGQKVVSLWKIKKWISQFEQAYTDIVQYVKDMSKYYKNTVSVGYNDGYIRWSIPQASDTWPTITMVFDIEDQSWYGPDVGYEIIDYFKRLEVGNSGGNGELYAIDHNCRIVQLDTGFDDYGQDIRFDVDLVRHGASDPGMWKEFFELLVTARISETLNVQVSTYNGKYVSIKTLSPGGNISKWDEATWQDGGGDGTGVWTDYDFYPYLLKYTSANTGFWSQIKLFSQTASLFSIAGIEYSYFERGRKTR